MIDVSMLSQDATDQIKMIKSGDVAAYELAQAQHALIRKINPSLNAFIDEDSSVQTDSALNNTLFAGLSIAVKDNIDVNGFCTTAGMETRADCRATNDAFVIDRLRTAGARFSGKLNMHEGALGATNHNSFLGDCFNPIDFALTPGGSSGGSGAAVASCLAPIALGTDTMGSIRIPASYCGVFGYKPSRGAVSNRGSVACGRVMDNIGPLTRSARDLTLVAKVIVGFDALAPESKPYKFTDQIPKKPSILVPEGLESLGVAADIIDDFERNITTFSALGFDIIRFNFAELSTGKGNKGYDFGAARRAGLIICEADMRVEHANDWIHQHDKFSPYLKGLLSYVDSKTAIDYALAEQVIEQAIVVARSLFTLGDFVLLPTTPQRAFSMTDKVPANQADLTGFANQAGLPAISLPMITDNHLPAGMQLLGPQGSDFQILNICEQWQAQSGYHYQIPAAILALI